MAYDEDKRLLEIPEATSIETDDFLYLDGATRGSRKLPTSMIPDLIPNATDSQKGLMSASDKDKLDNLAEVAESGSAINVFYDATGASIVTEDNVQGAITALDEAVDEVNSSLTQNDLGARVDISSYTTTSNMYTCPCDGFVCADLSASTTAKSIIRIFGATGTANQISIGGWANSTYGSYSCFVRKGMKLMVATLENNGKAFFIPLE